MLYIQLYNILGFAEDGYEIYTGLLHTVTCSVIVLLIKPFVRWCSLSSRFPQGSVLSTPEELKTYTALFLRLDYGPEYSVKRTELLVNALHTEDTWNADFAFSCVRKWMKKRNEALVSEHEAARSIFTPSPPGRDASLKNNPKKQQAPSEDKMERKS